MTGRCKEFAQAELAVDRMVTRYEGTHRGGRRAMMKEWLAVVHDRRVP